MAERTTERLVRLLGIVAYLDRMPGVPVEQVAQHFGVTPDQVLADVDTLWMSGTPGYWPDDLIDFDAGSLESGVLRLTQSRGMSHALRLGTREAVALVAALRALQEAVGPALAPEQREVVASTLATLTAATGEAAATVEVQLAVEGAPAVLEALRSALARGRRVHLRYVNAADATSERDVDPWALLTGDEHSYLQGLDHSVGAERLFRLDRVLDAVVLDEAASPAPRRLPDATFTPQEDHQRVVLELEGSARWVAEQAPVDAIEDLPDGGVRVTLRVGSPAWLQQLLLRLAPRVRDVDPVELATSTADAARRALALYGEDVGADAGGDEPSGGPAAR